MYHATDLAHVEAILTNGINLSTGPKQMLGDGVYCSLTIKKVSQFEVQIFNTPDNTINTFNVLFI